MLWHACVIKSYKNVRFVYLSKPMSKSIYPRKSIVEDEYMDEYQSSLICYLKRERNDHWVTWPNSRTQPNEINTEIACWGWTVSHRNFHATFLSVWRWNYIHSGWLIRDAWHIPDAMLLHQIYIYIFKGHIPGFANNILSLYYEYHRSFPRIHFPNFLAPI